MSRRVRSMMKRSSQRALTKRRKLRSKKRGRSARTSSLKKRRIRYKEENLYRAELIPSAAWRELNQAEYDLFVEKREFTDIHSLMNTSEITLPSLEELNIVGKAVQQKDSAFWKTTLESLQEKIEEAMEPTNAGRYGSPRMKATPLFVVSTIITAVIALLSGWGVFVSFVVAVALYIVLRIGVETVRRFTQTIEEVNEIRVELLRHKRRSITG